MKENNDKLSKIRNYFKELDISVPIDVDNAIQDVFDENDNIDGVDLYLKGDLEDFQLDTTLENKIFVSLKGISKGRFVNVFTYYGGCEYSLSEKYLLIKDNDVNESGSKGYPRGEPDDESVNIPIPVMQARS